jgi:3-oxoacid CoA-transferase subunit B
MTWTHEQMCKIAAQEMQNGMYVNLGIGLPTEVPNYMDPKVKVMFHSENGMLGTGPFPKKGKEDPDLINASKETVTVLPGGCFFSSAESFAMVRGGHIDLTILGAFQVAQNGDLANWTIPGKLTKGMGGAMDLVANVKRVVVLMTHTSKDGAAKLVDKCSLPLTGAQVVDRVITELGVFDITPHGMLLVKKPNEISIEEIKSKTPAAFHYNPI